ncbi:D-amino acid aminotransferase [Parapusillimonas granuli]|uniref:D-amino acid aminotransferase n=1 Tax=Parapusillimonas granuli TaxID=380911 RepID=A0A853FZ07_9BURK|nr:D-amino acid aminotransferase [Parapusillimonas granuli]MBB5215480.1 D-alanine transaminase [Parapusillimonas granuli]MEB2400317.1 D-amino acid aminotransferase [Alcaligenaceae bacterium]NYT49853.1 D-amino acid aminotransferase [Parapusillimonas granuli]
MIPDVDNDSIVYLNGDYVRLGDAKISVLDRGFIFGDGIYDVVPAYEGKPFRMNGHLARLERSLAAIDIKVDLKRADWERIVHDLIGRSGLGDCMVYIQVTRGVAKRDHAFPKGVAPTIFCMVSPFVRPGAQVREQGMSVVSMTDMRWLRCEIKSVSLLGNVLAKQHAVDNGVDEVIQFRDGYMSEGSSCNIWMVKDGVLLAPPRSNLILEGIRYGLLEELAEAAGIPFNARPISQQEVDQADELMLSSATKELLPITTYNGKPVGSGKPGPVYAKLREGYDRAIAAL